MEEEVCILCDKALSPEQKTTAKERAISKLIEASKHRKDKKYLRLQKLKEVDIQPSCQTMYVRQSSIKTATTKTTASTSKRRQSAREARTFDFNNLCFFCGEDAPDIPVRKHAKLGKVVHLTSPNTKVNVLKKIEERSTKDEYNREIYERLKNIDDLTDLNARYHTAYIINFYQYRGDCSAGRPMLESTLCTVSLC